MQDRLAIYEYIEARNPLAAIDLDELIADKTKRLTDHPESGRLGRVSGTRELVAHKHYAVVYDIARESETVRILRVLHTSLQIFP